MSLTILRLVVELRTTLANSYPLTLPLLPFYSFSNTENRLYDPDAVIPIFLSRLHQELRRNYFLQLYRYSRNSNIGA